MSDASNAAVDDLVKQKVLPEWVSPTKRDITFGFTFGAEFEDRYGSLKGRGKHARHVKIRTFADADQEALRYYIRQAVERDAR